MKSMSVDLITNSNEIPVKEYAGISNIHYSYRMPSPFYNDHNPHLCINTIIT